MSNPIPRLVTQESVPLTEAVVSSGELAPFELFELNGLIGNLSIEGLSGEFELPEPAIFLETEQDTGGSSDGLLDENLFGDEYNSTDGDVYEEESSANGSEAGESDSSRSDSQAHEEGGSSDGPSLESESTSSSDSYAASASSDTSSPPLSDFSSGQAAIRRRGFELANARRSESDSSRNGLAGRLGSGRSGGSHAGLDSETAAPEPEFDPVPDATQHLVERSNRLLDAAVQPQLSISPLGHVPEIGVQALSQTEFQILLSLGPDEVPEGLDAEQLRIFEQERERLNALRSRLESSGEEVISSSESAEVEQSLEIPQLAQIEDLGPPPRLDLSRGRSEAPDMVAVFARLTADSRDHSLEIIRSSRQHLSVDGASVGSAIDVAYPDFAEEELGQSVSDLLNEKVTALAESAGITSDEIRASVSARAAELEELRQAAYGEITFTVDEVCSDMSAGAEQSLSRSDAVVSSAEETADEIRDSAAEIDLSESIPLQRDRLLGAVTEVVSAQVTQYRQQGELRSHALTIARRAQENAYRLAAQRDIYKIRSDAESAAESLTSAAIAQRMRDSESWRDERLRFVAEEFARLRSESTQQVELYQNEVREAGDLKRQALRSWADNELGISTSEEERALQLAEDQAAQLEAEARAWAEVENQRSVASIANDFGAIESLQGDVRDGIDREVIAEQHQLSQREREMLDAYLTPVVEGESEESRLVNAVTVGARGRIGAELQPNILTQMQDIIAQKPESEWGRLQYLAAVQSSGFNGVETAQKIRKAIAGPGTDEAAIFSALAGIKPLQVKVVRGIYIEAYDVSLDDDLADDLSGRELERAQALVRSEQDTADAIGLRQAMYGNYEGALFGLGNITGLGTDNDAIHEIMRSRDPARAAELNDAFAQISPEGSLSLSAAVESEIEEEEGRERFRAELSGNRDLADAYEMRSLFASSAVMRSAQRPHSGAYPTADIEAIERIYTRIRSEVTARGNREGWDSDRIEAEIALRNQTLEREFNARFNEEFGNPEGGAFRTAIDVSYRFQPGQRNLATALADNDLSRADAARIEIENRGVYADDDIQNRVLESQYLRRYDELTTDEMPIRRLIMSRQLVERERNDPDGPWTGARLDHERRTLEREINRNFESLASEQAGANMQALRDAYLGDYGGDLDSVILSNTSGYDNTKALRLLTQDGYLTPAQQVYFSVRGSGTDEDALRRALEGRTREELDEMRAEFAEIARTDTGFRATFARITAGDQEVDANGIARGFGNMDDEIADDLSGRLAFDMGQLLQGEPETLEERRERLVEAMNYELNSSALGDSVATGERRMLQTTIDNLDRTIGYLNDPTVPLSQRDAYISAFETDIKSVNSAIQMHRDSLDSLVNTISTVISVVVAVAVIAIISFFTMGVGGAVLVGLAGSILGSAATMGTKYLVLGDQYGWEDSAVDFSVAIVDAVLTLLTAGLASKLTGALKAGGAAATGASRAAMLAGRTGPRAAIARFMLSDRGKLLSSSEGYLARLIRPSARLEGMIQRGGMSKHFANLVAETGENFLQASGAAFTTTALNENTWEKGNPLANLLSGTMQQAGTTVGIGMAAKPIQGIIGGVSVARDAFDRVRTPSISELRAEWESFRLTHPESTYADFVGHRMEAGTFDFDRSARSMDGQGADLADIDATTRLSQALPENLRENVAVVVDPDLPGRTVKVEYKKSLGGITEVRVVAGVDARPIDIVLHAPVVQSMQRYVGMAGRVVQLIERLRFALTKRGTPPLGSIGWEAHLELNKLPAIIDDRLRSLVRGGIDSSERINILRDVTHLLERLDQYQRIVDVIDVTPGRGFVAADDYRAPVLDTRPSGSRSDLQRLRYKVDDSSLKSKEPPDSIFQVGPSWKEDGRTYRVIEILNSDGTVKAVREEIRMLDSAGNESNWWKQRGSDSNKSGILAEHAAQLQSQADVAASGGRLTQIPSSMLQSSSGAGFDQAQIRFDSSGNPTIVIIEVKHYPDSYVPFAEFTAINQNLITNFDTLKSILKDVSNAEALGLSKDQLRAAYKAAMEGRVEIEVRTSATTKLGEHDRGSVLKNLLTAARSQIGNNDIRITRRVIDDVSWKTAVATSPVAKEIGALPRMHELAGVHPNNYTSESVRRYQTALTAENANGVVSPPFMPSKPAGYMVDSNGVQYIPLEVAVGNGGRKTIGENSLGKVSESILTTLRGNPASSPSSSAPPNMLVDVSGLTLKDRDALITKMRTRARALGDPNLVSRVVFVDVNRGTAVRLRPNN